MQYAPTRKPQKINAFSRSIMYPVNFLGLGRGLDFLLPSFLVSRQGLYRGREVFLGTFSRSIMYPVNFLGLGRGLDFLLPSFLVSRQEKKVGAWGQSPRFSYHKIYISGKCTAFPSFIEYEYPKRDAFSDYMVVISKNVICFAHSPSLGWRSVGRMQYAPT